MTRTVWFALSCLAGLSTIVAIVAIKAVTLPSPVPVAAPPEQHAASEDSLPLNRATKTDRLPLVAASEPAEAASLPQMGAVLSAETPTAATDGLVEMPENVPAKPTTATTDETPRRAADTRPHRRRWRDANAKQAATSPPRRHARRRRMQTEAENPPPKETVKETVDVPPCRQDAVSGLMRTLNLSPRCGS